MFKIKELEKFREKVDKGEYGIFPPPTSDREGLKILIEYFLGDYYSVNPISQEQFNTEAICRIINKYPTKEGSSIERFLKKWRK